MTCAGLTDATVFTIAEHCKHLQHVSLATFNRLSCDAVNTLVEHCTVLKTLHLPMCFNDLAAREVVEAWEARGIEVQIEDDVNSDDEESAGEDGSG